MKLLLVDELRKNIQPWIKKYKPQLVIVFGSAIQGMPGPEPDLDLALFFGHEVDTFRALSDLHQYIHQDKIDTMYLDDAEPIARMTASEGVLIYEDVPGRMDNFISLSLRQFMDHEKFFRLRRELNNEFLVERGFA